MGYIVKMPKLGMDMDRGTVVEWLVDEGDEVTEGQVVAEIESEKTTGEIEVREDGVLRHVLVDEGESAEPGGDVAVVGGADEDVSDLLAEAGGEAASGGDAAAASGGAAESGADGADAGGSAAASGAAGGSAGSAASREVKATPRAKKRAEELGVDLGSVEGTGPQGAVSADDVEAAAESGGGDESEAADEDGGGAADADAGTTGPETAAEAGDAGADGRHVFAPPRVRRLARELGVDLDGVDGTGAGGAITESDVRAAAGDGGAVAAGEGASVDGAATGRAGGDGTGTRDEERPLSGMRATIAKRLGQSYREAVHVTEHRTADAEELLRAADAADDALGPKVTVNDVLLLAVSATLDEHPAFNATFEDDVHRLREAKNVCVAVDVEAGLVAPVVRDAGSLSLAELADERRAVTERALSGEHTMDDLTGGTFTVTNLGVLGVESFDPVINPPQVAILGVDAIEEAVVPVGDGEVGVRERIGFDLSFDHRVVDGADAARFLATLVGHVEDPWPLVVAAGGR